MDMENAEDMSSTRCNAFLAAWLEEVNLSTI